MVLKIPSTVMSRANVIDVTDVAYGADKTGATDSTAAIQLAINAQLSTNARTAAFKFIYFPPGTYLISDTLVGRISDPYSDGWRAGFVMFGVDRDNTVIKLAANATGFGNAASIKPMVTLSSEKDQGCTTSGCNPTGGGNQGFRNGVYGLSFDLNSNAGAAAIDIVASNRGGVENVKIFSATKTGRGINCSRADNGPCLIYDVEIEKCDKAIYQAGYTYGVVLSNVTIRNQNTLGIEVVQPNLAIENLQSYNNVTAVKSTQTNGLVSIVNSTLQLDGGQSRSATYGVEAAGMLKVRNLRSNAYNTPVRNTKNGTVNVLESDLPTYNGFPTVENFSSYANKFLFPSNPQSLPVKQAPDAWSSSAADWAVYGDYGGTGTLQQLQNTIDAGSGRKLVALPNGTYTIDGDLYIRGVSKIIGFQSQIRAATGTTPTIYFDSASSDGFTVLESLYITGCKVVHRSTDTLHIKHCDVVNGGYENTSAGTGDVFFTDAIVEPVVMKYGQKGWARQLNCERKNIQVEIEDGSLWFLGFKTECLSGTAQTNIKATRADVELICGSFIALGSAQNSTTPKTPSIELIDCRNFLGDWNCIASSSGIHDIQVRETQGSVTRNLNRTSLNGSSPTCTSFSGGTQEMQLFYSASAPYDGSSASSLVAANSSAWAAVAGAGFTTAIGTATLTAATGKAVFTGTDLGGNYEFVMNSAFRLLNSNVITDLAQAVEVIIGTSGSSTIYTAARNSSAKNSNSVPGGFSKVFTIPVGTTQFSVQPRWSAYTTPSGETLRVSEIVYKVHYIGQ